MLLDRARLPWVWLLFATATTATITSSNSSTAIGRFQGMLPLRHTEGDRAQIAQLVPLTRAASQRTIEGNLYNTSFSNVANITASDIAFISCNTDDYPGYLTAQSLFENAYGKANISGVILYSTATDYCGYEQNNNQDMMQNFPVLSMTNKADSATLRTTISNLGGSANYSVQVQGRSDDSNNNNNNNNNGGYQQQNPLGPSPSTAVAMIILYSITGIITALFLIIIVTGAIRAHRHPERYGPRDVLGRPRQSRARGLGRAILDTIPIVKFGEKEPEKPTDVELASTAETGEANRASAEDGAQTSHAAAGPESTDRTSTSAAHVAETTPKAPETLAQEHQEGIAPAQALATSVVSGANNSSHDENLGCSICTEDFEKGQDLRVLPCDHKFHPDCVDPWLLNVSGTCPLCRVDLHPVTSHDSNVSQVDDGLAPPLNPEAETSSRRRTIFHDILSLRHRPNASAEERISALRRLREQRRNQSGEVAEGSANASTEDVATRDRRSKRMSLRLSDVFSGRTRRERHDESAEQPGESSTSAHQQPPPRDGSPSSRTNERQN